MHVLKNVAIKIVGFSKYFWFSFLTNQVVLPYVATRFSLSKQRSPTRYTHKFMGHAPCWGRFFEIGRPMFICRTTYDHSY